MNSVTLRLQAEPLIRSALREDITSEDISTASVIDDGAQGQVRLVAKQGGVICGLDVFERTFQLLDDTARLVATVQDVKKVCLVSAYIPKDNPQKWRAVATSSIRSLMIVN